MPNKPRMTLDDVLEDMRAHGMPIGKGELSHCLKGIIDVMYAIYAMYAYVYTRARRSVTGCQTKGVTQNEGSRH